MNRLLLSKFYLVGPMDFDRASGIAWRQDIGAYIRKRGAIALDPYNKPTHNGKDLENDDFHAERTRAMSEGRYDDVSKLMKGIRNVDLRMVDYSDAIICNLDMEKRPCGTIEEIVLANREKKPVMIYCPQGKDQIPPWLYGMLPHELFFDMWGDIRKYLTHIDEDDDIDTLGRWCFFDLVRETADIIWNYPLDGSRLNEICPCEGGDASLNKNTHGTMFSEMQADLMEKDFPNGVSLP